MLSILDENFVVAISHENGNENEEPARKKSTHAPSIFSAR